MSAATERTQHVVTAHPGFTVLEPIADDAGEFVEFYRHPVIAWRVELTYSAPRRDHIAMTVPVTVDWCDTDAAIEDPTGRIVMPEGVWFDTEAEALAYLNEAER